MLLQVIQSEVAAAPTLTTITSQQQQPKQQQRYRSFSSSFTSSATATATATSSPLSLSIRTNPNIRLFSASTTTTTTDTTTATASSLLDNELLRLCHDKKFQDVEQLLQESLEQQQQLDNKSEDALVLNATTVYSILSSSANSKHNNTASTRYKRNPQKQEYYSTNVGDQTESLLSLLMAYQEAGRIIGNVDWRKCCTICIRAWAKTTSYYPQAGERAEHILTAMEDKLAQQRPDTIVYTSVINVHAKLGNVKAAEAIFLRMLEDYHDHGNEQAKPDLFSLNTLMKAFSRSRNKSQQADDDTKMAGGEQAELLLNKILHLKNQMQSSLDLQPDCVTYTATMQAYAEHGKAKEAERIFNRMVDDYQSGNNPNAKPDDYAFGTLIKALAVEGAPNAGEQADRILERMRNEFDMEPDRNTLNFAKRCWAATTTRSATKVKKKNAKADAPTSLSDTTKA